MEFENLLKLIETVSSSELTHFSMKEGEFKLSMGRILSWYPVEKSLR